MGSAGPLATGTASERNPGGPGSQGEAMVGPALWKKSGFGMERMKKTMGIAGVTLMALAATAGAQAPAWEKVLVPDGGVWEDPDWNAGGFGWGPKEILAVDRSGRIYVSNGPKLHVAQRGGNSWQTLYKPRGTSDSQQKRPLGAGAEGTVMWGEWLSKDGGVTWDTLGRAGGYYATCIYKDGSALFATGLDGIERSAPPWKTWQYVHRGETFGHIESFHYTENGPILAMPSVAGLLQSMDSGKTWNGWKAGDRGRELNSYTVRTLDFEGTSGTPALMLVAKDDERKGNLLVRMHVVFPQLDTLKTVLPDSPATALQVTKDGAIWIAIRGQGVLVSRDKGRTFTAQNQGLGNLFVEALEMTSDGDLYAFTRGGIYRIRNSTAVAPRFAAPGSASRSRFVLTLGGLPPALQPHGTTAAMRIQADGRLLITPVQ